MRINRIETARIGGQQQLEVKRRCSVKTFRTTLGFHPLPHRLIVSIRGKSGSEAKAFQ
jgi:hypothetical protein